MEAAGLVLGVIPLAIKALDTYRDVLSTIKNAKRDIEYMIRDLKTEHQILQNTCEALLRGIVPDSVLDDMIEDPFGPAWKQYEGEVRLRLWRSADVFQERVTEMRQAAMDLQQKLAIDSNGKVRPDMLCTSNRISKGHLTINGLMQTRLVDRRSIMEGLKHSAYFTLKKKDYNEIMSRLKGGNAVLNTLANQNSSLEPTRRSRSQAKLARLVRKLSQGMYGALRNVITCSCAGSHNLGLELSPRKDIMLPGDEEDEIAQSLDFGVVIGRHAQKQSQRWDKVRVKLAANEIVLPSTPPTTPSPDLPRPRSPRIRWSIRTPQTRAVVSHKTDQHASHLSVPFQGGTILQPLAITNLCHMLRKGKGITTVPDYCGYISNTTSKFNLYHQHCQPGGLSAVTLRTILDDHGAGIKHFKYAQRLEIAICLSYSVLHLYNTPWLARTFTTDDIVFIMEQQAANSHTNCLGRPFLASLLPKPSASACKPPEQVAFRPMDLTILSLGLLLVQIIIGRHVQDLSIEPDNKAMDAIISKQEAASQMTGSILENGGMNYANAVQWCLSSVLCGACLDDENVGQEFHEAVISRLEADMRRYALMHATG